MNKTEALRRLSSLENEAKAIRSIIEASDAPKSILERCHTIEDACHETDVDIHDLYKDCKDEYEKAEVSIKTFAKALREGKPASECFYYPFFYRSSDGGFSCQGYDGDLDCTEVGARLRVDTPEKAAHLGSCMENQYIIYLHGN